MTPMADLFRNIHNETAYANSSTHLVALDTSDAEQTDWYFQVNAALYLLLQKVTINAALSHEVPVRPLVFGFRF